MLWISRHSRSSEWMSMSVTSMQSLWYRNSLLASSSYFIISSLGMISILFSGDCRIRTCIFADGPHELKRFRPFQSSISAALPLS